MIIFLCEKARIWIPIGANNNKYGFAGIATCFFKSRTADKLGMRTFWPKSNRHKDAHLMVPSDDVGEPCAICRVARVYPHFALLVRSSSPGPTCRLHPGLLPGLEAGPLLGRQLRPTGAASTRCRPSAYQLRADSTGTVSTSISTGLAMAIPSWKHQFP